MVRPRVREICLANLRLVAGRPPGSRPPTLIALSLHGQVHTVLRVARLAIDETVILLTLSLHHY